MLFGSALVLGFGIVVLFTLAILFIACCRLVFEMGKDLPALGGWHDGLIDICVCYIEIAWFYGLYLFLAVVIVDV